MQCVHFNISIATFKIIQQCLVNVFQIADILFTDSSRRQISGPHFRACATFWFLGVVTVISYRCPAAFYKKIVSQILIYLQ